MSKLLRFVSPSLLGILLGFVLFTAGEKVDDFDVWYHVFTGNTIWNTGFPASDYTSFTIPADSHWVLQEWLSQIIFFLFSANFGFESLAILKGIIIAVVIGLLYYSSTRKGENQLIAFFLCFLSYLLISGTIRVRPQIFSFALFLTFLRLLEADRNGKKEARWVIPPLFVLWANLHGAFLMGIIIFSIQIIGSFAQSFIQLEKVEHARAYRLLPVLLLSIIAGLCTPNGLHAYSYAWFYAGNNFAAGFIDEWQSPNFHVWWPLRWYIVFFWLSLAAGRFRFSFSDLLTAAMLTAMNLFAKRHVPFFLFCTVPIFCFSITQFLKGNQEFLPTKAESSQPEFFKPLLKRVGLILLLCTGIFSVMNRPEVKTAWNIRIDESKFPVKATKILSSRPILENLFNEFQWGHYLTFHLYPKVKVYIDGRCDIFGPQIVQDYKEAVSIDPSKYKKVFAKYQIRTALVSDKNPLYFHLFSDPEWICTSDEPIARLFEKRTESSQ